MPYVELDLPNSLPASVHTIIRGGVEPLFRDVHWMLSTLIAQPGDEGPRRQLQIPILHVLLATIAGVSTQLYSGPGGTGNRLKKCLLTYFPWDIDPPKGVPNEKAAEILYDVFRNPLVHSLGLHKDPVKVVQVFRGADNLEQRVEELERCSEKPYSEPCLVVTTEKRILWLDPLYWGVRKLVERWSNDPNEVSLAASKFKRRA